MSNFPFQKILIIGATSGIGEGFADKFVSEGRKIIITGRRVDRLENFIATHPTAKDRISSYEFDIRKLEDIPAWVERVSTEHPDIDCLFVNCGIVHPADYSRPETTRLSEFDEELKTNYAGPVHLTQAFLPFLINQAKTKPTALMYTGSSLGLVPYGPCIGYSATKAALHSFLFSLRTHVKPTGIRVIELVVPVVKTALLSTGAQDVHEIPGMELDLFLTETLEYLKKGNEYDEYPVDVATLLWEKVELSRKWVVDQGWVPQGPAEIVRSE